MSAFSGLQVGDARLCFYIPGEITGFDYVSMDAWYYEGDETIIAADFNFRLSGKSLDTRH